MDSIFFPWSRWNNGDPDRGTREAHGYDRTIRRDEEEDPLPQRDIMPAILTAMGQWQERANTLRNVRPASN